MSEQTFSPAKKKKMKMVELLEEKLKKASSFFLLNYQGLSHPQMESLRKTLKKVQGELMVVKNSLLEIALKKTSLEKFFSFPLREPTALLLNFSADTAPLRAVAYFLKNYPVAKIKAGIFSGQAVKKEDFLRLANLPSRKELYSLLAWQVKTPLLRFNWALKGNWQKLVSLLNQIKEKKGKN